MIAIDRRRARLGGRASARRPGTVRIVDPVAALAEIMDVWDRYRVRRAGEIDRPEAWFRVDIAGNPDTVHVLHADGYAGWRFERTRNDGHPSSSWC